MLAIPVLAGSTSYAVAEAFAWGASLDLKPALARKFYGVMGLTMALGMAVTYSKISAIHMLFWSAVVNGVLAPPLIVLVVLLTSDRKLMGEHANSRLLKWLGWTSAAVMTFAALFMFLA